jgi:hypothetical protein
MNREEARFILMAYRPGEGDARDPDVAEALALAENDPALRLWLERQIASQAALRESLRRIPVPPNLRNRILAIPAVVELPIPSRRRPWLPLAAAVALLLGLAALWFKSGSDDSFATFRDRMARKVLREYTMDIVTADRTRIRQFLATNGAPAEFSLPQNLDLLPALGAGLQRWQGQRVSRVCLDGGAQGTLFLFVVDGAGLKRPPGASPEFVPVSKLMTASWTQGGKAYVLAGTSGREALRKNF